MRGPFLGGLLAVFGYGLFVRYNISGLQRKKMTHLCDTLREIRVLVTGEGQTR